MTPFDDTSGSHRPPPPPDPWAQVGLALSLLAIDPKGLRGLWLRGRAGPVRDRVLAALAPLAPRKLHPFMPEDALSGGLDLSATLAMNSVQRHEGLLARDGVLTLTMAERCPPGLSVRLGQALDARPGLALIALDEAAEEGEGHHLGLARVVALELLQHLFNHADLLGKTRITDINNMHQQVCFMQLFQGGLEGLEQFVRQIPDKTYRVSDNDLNIFGKTQPAAGRIKGGKELVLRIDVAFGQTV